MNLHGEDVSKQAKFVLSDTMVQGNNTTFSADSKMDKKVIDKCNKVAAKEGISQHSKYLKASTSFRQATMGNIRKRAKQARKAIKRLKTMANIQLRELEKNDRRSKIVLPIRF